MGVHKIISVVLICFIFLAKCSPSHAQNSPKDYVDAHNAARSQVGVGAIAWDDDLAASAQGYANQRINDCQLVHSGGPYGENLAKSTGLLTGVEAVRLWVNEKSNYDYNSNTCKPGAVCGHYTQVVWRDSIRLGCARVQCSNNGSFIICSYDPPGNFEGERPY